MKKSLRPSGSLTRQSARGFTLVEVIVAMVILTGGIVMLANVWSGNVARLEKSRINNKMAFLLQKKMSEYEIRYQDKPAEIPEEESGGFEGDDQQFSWSMQSKEFEVPDMSGALISQEGGADEMLLTMIREVQEYIKQTVKEVTVTVTYTSRKNQKALKHSITTLVVDYDKDLPIAGGLGAGGQGQGQ